MIFGKNQPEGNLARLEKLCEAAGYDGFTPLQSTLLPLLPPAKDIEVLTEGARGLTFALAAGLLLRKTRGALLLCPEGNRLEEYALLAAKLNTCEELPAGTLEVIGLKENPRRDHFSLKQNPRILISSPGRLIDHLRRNNLSLQGKDTLWADFTGSQDQEGFERDLSFVLAKASRIKNFGLFYPQEPPAKEILQKKMRRALHLSPSEWEGLPPEKNLSLNQKKETSMKDPKELKKTMQDVIQRIRLEEDPQDMIAWKKAFKKSVPLMMRGYVSGLLMKEMIEGSRGRRRPARKERGSRTSNKTEHPDRPDDITLFVGVGKNRKVFPRDIIGLFISAAGLEREDIGNIRILDSYSFVGIQKDKAPQVIEKLNGTPYRGRDLKIDFSKDKKSS